MSVPNASRLAQRWRSSVTPPRLAALAVVAVLGVAACSPSGAATTSPAAAAPMNMTAGATNMVQPATSAAATQVPSATTVPSGAEAKVSISNFAFDPAVLTVKVGSTVTWTNNDIVAHTVTFTDVANSPVLNRGDHFSRTFTKAGTYSYICSIHPFMHGMVVVTP
jgi:amicyanin